MKTIEDSQVYMSHTNFMPSFDIKLLDRSNKTALEMVNSGLIINEGKLNPSRPKFDLNEL